MTMRYWCVIFVCAVFGFGRGAEAFLPAALNSFLGVASGSRERRQIGENRTSPVDFLDGLVYSYGTNGQMTNAELQLLLDQVNAQCYTSDELLDIYSLTSIDLRDDPASVIEEICPSVLYQSSTGECMGAESTTVPPPPEDDEDALPTTAQVWGYGLLCVTIINCGSLMGAFVIPCMNKNIYKLILIYLIGLAVGTLTGSAVLHLIPKTHGLKVKKLGNPLVWKNTCILGGIYLFFFAERILKIVSSNKDAKHEKIARQDSVMHANGMYDHGSNTNAGYKITSAESALELADVDIDEKGHQVQDGHSHGEVVKDGKVRIKTVAYMIVFGDGLHNFVDGLAIGASFAGSLLSGFSTSIAVICEEFPHELGDFAVLLQSGLSVKQAMGFNFLSSMTCYAGLVVGIIVGRLTEAEPYIFALAAGMFLYIALVDMLPEIANVSAKKNFKLGSELKIFLLQNGGILSGFGIMILLSVLHPYIKIKG